MLDASDTETNKSSSYLNVFILFWRFIDAKFTNNVLYHILELYSHPCCVILDYVVPFKRCTPSISNDFLYLLPLASGTTNLFFVSVDLPNVDIKHKWDHIPCGLCVYFFFATLHNALKIQPYSNVNQNFVFSPPEVSVTARK